MDEKPQLKDFALGHNQFTEDIYKELIKSNFENLLVCPLSANIILALVHAGAKDKTAEQLSNALHLPKTLEDHKQNLKKLNTLLQPNEYRTITSANKIYVREGCEIKDEFKKKAEEEFLAEIENINFGNKKEAAGKINKWVEEKTENKIKNMVAPGELSKDISAILINAVYFQGRWARIFKKSQTQKKPFYLNNEDQIDVDMMTKEDYYYYYEDTKLNAKYLGIQYRGGDVTMTFVLPNEKNGLSDLEISHLTEAFKPDDSFSHELVRIVIPKFKIETDIELKPILQTLGIQDAFQPYANFSEILANEPLIINQVFQKAFIDVNEDGTTAAAATKLCPKACCLTTEEPFLFIADHPFIFILRIHGIILFVGRCVSPKY